MLAQSIYVKHSNPQVNQKPEQKHSNHSLYFRKQKPSLMELKHSCLTSTTRSITALPVPRLSKNPIWKKKF